MDQTCERDKHLRIWILDITKSKYVRKTTIYIIGNLNIIRSDIKAIKKANLTQMSINI